MDKDYLTEKWLNDELTSDEKHTFMRSDDYEFNLKLIDAAKNFKASQFSNADDFKTFKGIYTNQKTQKGTILAHPLFRVAAVLIVALGLYFGFMYNPITQVRTLAGVKEVVELPDQSIVTLNASSSLSYYASKWKTKRSLNLDGEAFFKVAKGKTFDVFTTTGTVTVVGTEFNVKNRKNYFEVKCYEGIVKVVSDTIVRTLKAGDTYQILNGEFKQDFTNFKSPQWIQNSSRFKAIPFNEIVNELKRQYNIEVILQDVDSSRLFTGGFEHQNLLNALISITKPMNFTYEMISSNRVVIHGNEE